MANLRIEFEPSNQAARDFVVDGVDNHNIARTGLSAYYPVAFFLKTHELEVMGGVLGMVWGEWLHITYLWVAEPLRSQGHATRLMERAESYARDRGCRGAFLETFSFQAKPLYEKLGYRVCGEIDNYPPGHVHYFLRKSLRTRKPKAPRKGRSKDNAPRKTV